MFNNNKKNNIVTINSNPIRSNNLGRELTCTICGKLFTRLNSIHEVTQHIENCQKNKKRNDFETLLRELKETNEELEKIHEMRSTIKSIKKKSNLFKEDRNSDMLIFDPIKKPNNKQKTINMNKIDMNFVKALPFEEKVDHFRKILKGYKIDWREGSQILTIDRENFFKQSITQIGNTNLYMELKINFLGEISHDAGGLIREWYTIIFKKLLSTEACFFEKADTDEYSFAISQNISTNIENLDTFYFIGRILGKALLDNLTVNTCFNKLIYKMILEETVTLNDLIFINKPVMNNLHSYTVLLLN